MSKKKSSRTTSATATKDSAAAKSSPAKRKNQAVVWAVAGVVVLGAIVGAVVLSGSGSKGGAGAVDPTEAKYMGRLLPANYEEPKLADIVVYTESTPMTDVSLTDTGENLELSASEVTEKRNVVAEYTRADGKRLPVIAYLKPSGKLFVGISFCPPCEGERQTIASDGTLTCDSCGTKRTLETGVGISGACKLYPLDELPVTVADGKITIQKSLIDNWTAQPLDRPVG